MRELFEQLMEKMKKEMEGVVRETLQATAKIACTKCIPRVKFRARIR